MKRRRTADRATTADPPPGAMHAPDRIGKTRSRTPEGFLLCEDVPIARTGWMVYGPGETGVSTNDSGVAMVHRGPEALFHPVTMASFAGKPVTDNHPPSGDVTAATWKEHARGTVHNVRRGEGEDADTLRADLLITDAGTIKKVEAGKVEVSAGYDANYETTGPGEGRQHNIVGNHVALVDRGRCGPRCSIGDSQFTQPRRKNPMAGKARRTVTEAVRKLFTDASEAAVGLLEEPPAADGYEGDDEDGSGTHVHVHMHGAGTTGAGAPAVGGGMTGGAEDAAAAGEAAAVGEGADPAANADPVEARFVKIESTLQAILTKLGGEAGNDDAEGATDPAENPDLVNDEEGDNPFAKKEEGEVTKTGDSAALATSFQRLVADCEVLVPGFKVPTFDGKLERKKTVDSMCATRRKALGAFGASAEGGEALQAIAGTKTVDVAGMSCQAAAVLFNGAVGVRKALNNRHTTGDGAGRLPIVGDGSTRKTTTLSIAEINELNRKKYPTT